MQWDFGTIAPIDELELRTQLVILEIVAKIPQLKNCHFLSLCDNQVAVHTLGRGRSKVFRLNSLLRRRWALEAVSHVSFLAAYVPTKHMPMDQYTRGTLVDGPLAEAIAAIYGAQDVAKFQD